jgi:L-lactate dehydrogenase
MKVGVVGSGLVGSTAAYALVMQGIGREIVLLDKSLERAEAEAADIRHAVPFAYPLDVRAGTYRDLAACRVILLCAGVGQKPGESRLQLLQRNAAVFADVIPQVLANAPDAVLVVAANPVGIMTHVAARYATQCGVASPRVLGSGTTLDTARFRSLLAGTCGVDAQHVHAHVVGEHGDSEVLIWSLVTVAGLGLEAFARERDVELTDAVRTDIDARVRKAADAIINGKKATYYGIGAALARITDVILHDQRSILTICTPAPDILGVRDVTVSLPRLLGGAGVLDTFPLPLNADEASQLRRSAQIVRSAIDELQ